MSRSVSSAAPKPMPTPEEILETALQLPKEQRLRLAEQLRESVEGDGWPEDLHPARRDEIGGRLDGGTLPRPVVT